MPDVTDRLIRQAAACLRSEAGQSGTSMAARVSAALGIAQGGGIGGERVAFPAGSGAQGSETTLWNRDELHRRELAELMDRKETLEPREVRRIAELTELFDGEDAAHPWWVAATKAGDSLAAEILAAFYPDPAH